MAYSKISILRFVNDVGEKKDVVPDYHWSDDDPGVPDLIAYLAEAQFSFSDIARIETDLDAFVEAIRQFPDNLAWMAMDGRMTWRGVPFYFVENEAITESERQARYEIAVRQRKEKTAQPGG